MNVGNCVIYHGNHHVKDSFDISLFSFSNDYCDTLTYSGFWTDYEECETENRWVRVSVKASGKHFDGFHPGDFLSDTYWACFVGLSIDAGKESCYWERITSLDLGCTNKGVMAGVDAKQMSLNALFGAALLF